MIDILLAMNGEDSYGRGGVFHTLASVGSWAECLTSAAHVSSAFQAGDIRLALIGQNF
jgi:hypothetical protein